VRQADAIDLTSSSLVTADPGRPVFTDADDLRPILELLGARSAVVQPPREWGGEGGGGDIDCVVDGLDSGWWQRLPPGWRLCQAMAYDVNSTYWVLEDGSRFVCVDTLADPDGVGKYGVPTSAAFDDSTDIRPAFRAAYLSSKRLRKGIRDPHEWRRIGSIAGTDPTAFAALLVRAFGGSFGTELAADVLHGRVPSDAMFRRVRSARLRALAARPLDLAGYLAAGSRRVVDRLTHPSGLYVLLVGPDGVGKSTLAANLLNELAPAFRRREALHWFPGPLPRPGAIGGKTARDPSSPHDREPYPRIVSGLATAYYWVDHLIAGVATILPLRVRSTLLVAERAWWDAAVDPRRYRLHPMRRTVRSLGRLLPQPDVTLVLDAPVESIAGRKSELSEQEIRRQVEQWRALAPGRRRIVIDAGRDADAVSRDARTAILDVLERRAASRSGAGWSGLPPTRSPRFLIPRGVRSPKALSLYQPVTRRSIAGWAAMKATTRIGGLALTPRTEAPSFEIRSRVAPFLNPGDSIAVARANHPDRTTVLVLSENAVPRAVVKLGSSPDAAAALAREAQNLRSLAPRLSRPLSGPEILGEDDGVLVLSYVPWHSRRAAWRLPVPVAVSMGEFFGRAASDGVGPQHGDFAPWNLLAVRDGFALVDWENAVADGRPFWDVFHYLIQSTVLLKRGSLGDVVEATRGDGRHGEVVQAYASAAGVPVGAAGSELRAYLEASLGTRSTDAREGELGRQACLRLLELLGAS
jgi:hypothetical protein